MKEATWKDYQERESMLLFGDNGTGKTKFLSALTENDPFMKVMFLDVETGGKTLPKSFFSEVVKVYQLEKTDSLGRETPIMAQLEEFISKVKKEKPVAVIIDSVGELCERIMQEEVKGGKRAHYHWDSMFGKVRWFIYSCKIMSRILIATALNRVDKDEEGSRIIANYPHILGKQFPKELSSQFDTMAYMSIKLLKQKGGVIEPIRTVSVKPDGIVTCRDRGEIEWQIENPTWKKFLETRTKKEE